MFVTDFDKTLQIMRNLWIISEIIELSFLILQVFVSAFLNLNLSKDLLYTFQFRFQYHKLDLVFSTDQRAV